MEVEAIIGNKIEMNMNLHVTSLNNILCFAPLLRKVQGGILFCWTVPRLWASWRSVLHLLRGTYEFCWWISMHDGRWRSEWREVITFVYLCVLANETNFGSIWPSATDCRNQLQKWTRSHGCKACVDYCCFIGSKLQQLHCRCCTTLWHSSPLHNRLHPRRRHPLLLLMTSHLPLTTLLIVVFGTLLPA
jgi:hypothetical protein